MYGNMQVGGSVTFVPSPSCFHSSAATVLAVAAAVPHTHTPLPPPPLCAQYMGAQMGMGMPFSTTGAANAW